MLHIDRMICIKHHRNRGIVQSIVIRRFIFAHHVSSIPFYSMSSCRVYECSKVNLTFLYTTIKDQKVDYLWSQHHVLMPRSPNRVRCLIDILYYIRFHSSINEIWHVCTCFCMTTYSRSYNEAMRCDTRRQDVKVLYTAIHAIPAVRGSADMSYICLVECLDHTRPSSFTDSFVSTPGCNVFCVTISLCFLIIKSTSYHY